MPQNSPPKITRSQLVEKVGSAFDRVDSMRADGLETLKLLHSVKTGALEKERERLKIKLGAGHPRVRKTASRIDYNQNIMKALDMEIQKTRIDVPELIEDTWMLHGIVYDHGGTPVKDLTVSLFNEKGKWVRELDYAATDRNGYFSILYPAKGKKRQKAVESLALFIHVSDAAHHTLLRDAVPYRVGIGTADYREIYLPSLEDGTGGAPPEPGPDEPVGPENDWVVKGWVADENDKPMPGLTVSLFDRDLFFDDYLGTTKTDENGNFEFIYRTEGFKDLLDKNPDLYLKVLDKKGKPLFLSKKAVKCGAGRIEVFNIKLEDPGKTKREFPIPPEIKKEKGK